MLISVYTIEISRSFFFYTLIRPPTYPLLVGKRYQPIFMKQFKNKNRISLDEGIICLDDILIPQLKYYQQAKSTSRSFFFLPFHADLGERLPNVIFQPVKTVLQAHAPLT